MGKVVVSQFVSVDGVIEDPGGSEDWDRGGWAFKYERGPEGDQFKLDEVMDSGCAAARPRDLRGLRRGVAVADGRVRRQVQQHAQVRRLDARCTSPEWNNTTVIRGDVAGEVAQAQASSRAATSSSTAAPSWCGAGRQRPRRRVPADGLPGVLGAGKRLFTETHAPASLELAESKQAGETTILVYRRAQRNRASQRRPSASGIEEGGSEADVSPGGRRLPSAPSPRRVGVRPGARPSDLRAGRPRLVGLRRVLGEDPVERPPRLGEHVAAPRPPARRCRRAATCMATAARLAHQAASSICPRRRRRLPRPTARRARRRCASTCARPASVSSKTRRPSAPRRARAPRPRAAGARGRPSRGSAATRRRAPLDLLHELVAVARLLGEQGEQRGADVAAPGARPARAGEVAGAPPAPVTMPAPPPAHREPAGETRIECV